MSKFKIGVVGCMGRMGRALTSAILDSEGATFAGGTEVASSPHLGTEITHPISGEGTGAQVGEGAEALFESADAVLDFTMPMATTHHAALAARTGTALVIGTTGFDTDQQAVITSAAEKTAIVQAGNMSLGVNLLTSLTRQVAASLGMDWDIEITEMHHRNKVDAPSGTALMLGEAAADGRGVTLANVSDRGRDGITGARKSGDIGFNSLRGGNVIGEHTVIFASDNERIELTHRATNRALFANGAVTAALWLKGRSPGLYSMTDVLGLD